jgi:toxin-antitoxin system PIN domain toxin
VILPDVNVLVYAHRADEDPDGFYLEELARITAGPAPFALSTLVAGGFLRIVTSRRAFVDPTPLPPALAAETLATSPGCRWVSPGPRHWTLLGDLCRATGAVGKAVADAQHAAVAIEHGCTLVSRDADFARFAPHGLWWRQVVPAPRR